MKETKCNSLKGYIFYLDPSELWRNKLLHLADFTDALLT